MGYNGPLDLGMKILPTGLGFKVGQNGPFYTTYDVTRYFVLLGSEKHNSIYDRIRYLISLKSCITHIISYNYATIKVDSYNSLPLGKTMTLRNVIILVKSVWNKDRNNYYYDIFLEKASYKLPQK